MTLVLASASPSRRALLEAAGLEPVVRPTGVDEAALKARLLGDGADGEAVALALARAKGEWGSTVDPEAWVLAGDQVLVCDGVLFDKPADLADARRHLQRLRGRTHTLIGATVLYRGGVCLWSHTDRADLTMRDVDDAFLDAYLDRAGETVLSSVGAYRLEAEGVQLFEAVEGGYFTILGLPVIDVLAALRAFGAIEA
jgi:septum formation protein